MPYTDTHRVVHVRRLTRYILVALLCAAVLLLMPKLSQGIPELFEAIRQGDCDRVRALIEIEPRAVASRSRGRTSPLHWAVEESNPTLVEMLLECGADVNCQAFDGATPLMVAAEAGDCEMVELLCVPELDLNLADRRGWTALHFAVSAGCCDSVELLLARGADISARTRGDDTPLSLAVRKGHRDVFLILEEHGALDQIGR
ncbi:MAG: ankyrin repeat domain-containing protein [bacterium]|nr:MAG: ankyrin repeat domain-containing protein [bacterium]